MDTIIILNENGKDQRFINPVPGFEIKKIKLPENCRFVYKSDITSEKLEDTPVVNDGFSPIFFDTNISDKLFTYNSHDAKLVIITMMAVMSSCSNSLKSNAKGVMIKQAVLNEKLELLEHESEMHKDKLNIFLGKESKRVDFFQPLPSCLLSDWYSLRRSKDRILNVVADIRTSLGEKENKLLDNMIKN